MSTHDVEDLETFRAPGTGLRPRQPPTRSTQSQSIGPLRNERTDEEELAAVARERKVQQMLFDADLAGICFPKEYGGQGLTPEHQRTPEPGAKPATSTRAPLPGPNALTWCSCPLGFRDRGAEATDISPPSSSRRGDLDAVPVRAQRRLGCRRRTDQVRSETVRNGCSTDPRSGRREPGGRTGGSA